jgi:hypothetical protein
MIEMLLGAAPFGDVKHTGDTIICDNKHELVGYGIVKYESYFTPGDKEIVIVDTVFSCVHMKVTDNTSNIKVNWSDKTDMSKTDMLFVLPRQPKVQPRMGLAAVT